MCRMQVLNQPVLTRKHGQQVDTFYLSKSACDTSRCLCGLSHWGAAVYKPELGQLFKGQCTTFTALTEEMVLECPSVHTDVQRFLAQCNLVTQGFQCFFLKLLLLFDFKTTYKVLNSDCFTIYSMQMFKMKLQEPGLLHF